MKKNMKYTITTLGLATSLVMCPSNIKAEETKGLSTKHKNNAKIIEMRMKLDDYINNIRNKQNYYYSNKDQFNKEMNKLRKELENSNLKDEDRDKVKIKIENLENTYSNQKVIRELSNIENQLESIKKHLTEINSNYNNSQDENKNKEEIENYEKKMERYTQLFEKDYKLENINTDIDDIKKKDDDHKIKEVFDYEKIDNSIFTSYYEIKSDMKKESKAGSSNLEDDKKEELEKDESTTPTVNESKDGSSTIEEDNSEDALTSKEDKNDSIHKEGNKSEEDSTLKEDDNQQEVTEDEEANTDSKDLEEDNSEDELTSKEDKNDSIHKEENKSEEDSTLKEDDNQQEVTEDEKVDTDSKDLEEDKYLETDEEDVAYVSKGVNVRNEAGTIIGYLKPGINIKGKDSGDKIEIIHGNEKATLYKDFVVRQETKAYTSKGVNVRDRDGKLIGYLRPGTVISGDKLNSRIFFNYKGQTASVYGELLDEGDLERFTSNGVNVRDLNGELLGNLPSGTFVNGKDLGDKIQIKYKGQDATIYKNYTSKGEVRKYSSLGVNVRDNEDEIVGYLNYGEKIKGRSKGERIEIIFNNIKATVHKKFIK